MSVTQPHPAYNPHGETSDRHATDQEDPLRIVKFIAGVLERAHTTAMTGNNTDEARAIFHVAMSFAEEFETGTPEFDRLRFLDAATGV